MSSQLLIQPFILGHQQQPPPPQMSKQTANKRDSAVSGIGSSLTRRISTESSKSVKMPSVYRLVSTTRHIRFRSCFIQDDDPRLRPVLVFDGV